MLRLQMLVAPVYGRLTSCEKQPVSATSLRIALVPNIVVRPVLVIVQSFVATQVLEARSILQRCVLYAAIHAEPVPMLHPVGL